MLNAVPMVRSLFVICGVVGGRRKGGTPAKNYRRDNRANIKEIEAINRQASGGRSAFL